jgi:Tat protein translocase TatB subunit
MNILGIGPAELIVIFIIALIVFGPGRLPELARTLGKATRELKRMSLEITAEFAKELRDVEAISREVKETAETIKQAADIERTLIESVEPALPSTDPSTARPSVSTELDEVSKSELNEASQKSGSEHRTAGESKEELKSSDVQETATQAEAENRVASGKNNADPTKENETEDHE